MPRRAKGKSSTRIYHVMLRGINGQIIFEDKEDYEKLVQIIIIIELKNSGPSIRQIGRLAGVSFAIIRRI